MRPSHRWKCNEMNTQQLLEKRAGLVRQMRDAQDAADASANGSMTPEQATAFDALKSALAALENALANRSLIEAAERRMADSLHPWVRRSSSWESLTPPFTR